VALTNDGTAEIVRRGSEVLGLRQVDSQEATCALGDDKACKNNNWECKKKFPWSEELDEPR